jgi:hypothetical protein
MNKNQKKIRKQMAKDRRAGDDFAMTVNKNQSTYVRRIAAAALRYVKPTPGKKAKVARRGKQTALPIPVT